MFDPLSPRAAAAPSGKHAVPAWRAVASALRAVAPDIEALAQAELAAPSWRAGQGVEDAAFAEGRKDLWRELLRVMKEEGT